MKTLRLLLIVLLALTESLRAWGMQTMVTGAMFGVACAAAAHASAKVPTPPMAGMHDNYAHSMRVAGARYAAPVGDAASRHHATCPLCSVATATPPCAAALCQPALREPFLGHGVMPFRSAIPDALDPPPRRSI